MRPSRLACTVLAFLAAASPARGGDAPPTAPAPGPSAAGRTFVLGPAEPAPLGQGRGPGTDVAAALGVAALALEDGGAVVWRDGAARRVPAPAAGERYRHVAVTSHGQVVALTTRGRLFDLTGDPAGPVGSRVQSQSVLVADASAPLAWLGTEGGALLRVDLARGRVEEAWPSGDAPVTAVAADGDTVVAGRGDGTVWLARSGAAPATVLTLEQAVAAVATRAGWVAVGDVRGRIAVWRAGDRPTAPSASPASADAGALRSLVFLPALAASAGGPPPLAALQLAAGGRATVTVLAGSPGPGPPADAATLRDLDVRAMSDAGDGRSLLLATGGPDGARRVEVRRAGGG